MKVWLTFELNRPLGRESFSGLGAYWPDFEWVEPEGADTK